MKFVSPREAVAVIKSGDRVFIHRVEADDPLYEHPGHKLTDDERAIGLHVAGLVEDGATLQMGIGAMFCSLSLSPRRLSLPSAFCFLPSASEYAGEL
jgi:acyl-CoA hydrolase